MRRRRAPAAARLLLPVAALLLAVLAGAALGAALALGGPAEDAGLDWPDPAGGLPPAGEDDPEAVALLERAARAEAEVAWRGEQAVMAWTPAGSASTVLEVAHDPATGTQVREHGGTARPSRLPRLGAVPSASSARLVAAGHVVRVGGREVVAGRDATVVVARGPAATASLWLDDATGVLLRREVRSPDGRLVGASGFLDVAVGDAGAAAALDGGTPVARDLGEELDAGDLRALRARGTPCPEELGAGMRLVDARTGGPVDAVHLTYSDGVSTVSVFHQDGALALDGLDGWVRADVAGYPVHVRRGAPATLAWQGPDVVTTVVADATPQAVAAAVASLGAVAAPQVEGPVTGLLQRLERGLDRLPAALTGG